MSERDQKAEELRKAITRLEAERSALGETVVEPALAALRQQLSGIEASLADRAAAEERKIVTVMFVDMSGFTAMSDKMDPEELRRIMNACFERLVPIVHKYEGTIDKFIGDELMALFGAPAAHEDDPERALRTALEMMEAIAAFNRAQGTELGIHIGVNTGPVIAGKIGADVRGDYSVLGDAVNVAARLEDASSAGEIFVGPNTYRRTATLFDFEELPPLLLKGKEQPVAVYRLIAIKAAAKPARGIEGLRSPLVGREDELENVRAALVNLRSGRGSVLAVVGEAGLGKSRLIAEALQSLAAGVSRAEGRALSYTAGMSYWMARDVLRALVGEDAGAMPAQIATALRASIEQFTPETFGDVYPYLGRLLEVPLEGALEERVTLLTGEALQSRILQAFHDYVYARAAQEPLILFWEDLHWCDPSSFGVLKRLVPLTREAPLLLLVAYRPDQDFIRQLLPNGSAADAQNVCVLELAPLTRKEGSSLIQNLLKIDNLPPKTRDLILNRAEGNPFFLEELLRSLVDAGSIVIEKDRATAVPAIEAVDVPETLQGVLMARIDRLSPKKKQILQNAAVIGRTFQQKVLALVQREKSNGQSSLDDALGELRRREFIQAHDQDASADEREYSFKHAITHEVAYNSLLVARRKELHKIVATAIESLFPERLDEFAPRLGYHFEKSDAPQKAIRYLRQAGQRAQATFANTEAIAFYRSALVQVDLLLAAGAGEPWQGIAAEVEESIGDIQQLIGKTEEARAAFEDARQRAPETDVVWASRLDRKTAKAWITDRQHDRAEQAYTGAEEILKSRVSSTREWEQEWLQIQLDRMWLYYWRGQVDELASLAERIRPLVGEHGTAFQRGSFFQGLTLMALRRHRYTADEKTIANAQASLAALEESNIAPEIAHGRFVLGFSYLWAEKFELAGKWIGEGLKLAETIGDIVLQSRCLTYLTVIYRRRGEVEQVRRYVERSLAVASAARMLEYIGMAKGNLAWVHLRQNDLGRAFEEASEGAAKLRETPQGHILLWVALWPLIGVAIAREQIDEAIGHISELLVPPQMAILAALETELRAAVEAWKAKDCDAAKRSLRKAADLARTSGYL